MRLHDRRDVLRCLRLLLHLFASRRMILVSFCSQRREEEKKRGSEKERGNEKETRIRVREGGGLRVGFLEAPLTL